MAALTSGQIVGIIGGTLGALIGIGGGIVGWLCSKDMNKYKKLLNTFMIILISLGIISVLTGSSLYLINGIDTIYPQFCTDFGALLMIVGGVNYVLQKNKDKKLKEQKNKTK